MPDTRDSVTHKFIVGGVEGYLHIGEYADGTPGEIFVHVNKEGSTVGGLMDAWAICFSLALQYGVPLRKLVDKFRGTKFDPSGFTPNVDVPSATSLGGLCGPVDGEQVLGARSPALPRRSC
jgi:ribonucleoside-diphosphate reductase alpha chain